MAFEIDRKVLFRHCDPAGIVYSPRYFEMVNDCVEVFFDEVLGAPFEEVDRAGGVPTAQINTKFLAPSRHSDDLTLALSAERIGTTSFTYTLGTRSGDETRFECKATIINVGQDLRPAAWAADVKTKLLQFKDTPA